MILNRLTNEDLWKLLYDAVIAKDRRVVDVVQMTEKDFVFSTREGADLKYYRRSYTRNGDSVTVGEAVAVELNSIYQPIAEVTSITPPPAEPVTTTRVETPKVEVTIRVGERFLAMTTPQQGYTARREKYKGREHVVVPVVALVEGVVHAMNSDKNEFIPRELFKAGLSAWEGKPLYEHHPLSPSGALLLGDVPELRMKKSFGITRNAAIDNDGRLLMEAWLDVEDAKAKAPKMLERVEAGEPVEISIGALVSTNKNAGAYKGKRYAAEWTALEPDHLALLPDGVLGACSRDMGCGLRAAADGSEVDEPSLHVEILYSEDQPRDENGRFSGSGSSRDIPKNPDSAHGTVVAKSKYGKITTVRQDPSQPARFIGHRKSGEAVGTFKSTHSAADALREPRNREAFPSGYRNPDVIWKYDTRGLTEVGIMDPIKALREISQEERDSADASDFAGPNESFPILKPEDVAAAAHALGRAKGDRNAIKKKIVKIAYRKGDDFVAQLPEGWKRASDRALGEKFAAMMDAARQFFTQKRALQDADEMTDDNLRQKLYDAIKEVEPNVVHIEAFYPVTDPSHVAYSCYHDDGGNYEWYTYERSFELSDAGVVTISQTKVEVERVTKYEPVEGASPSALSQNTGAGNPSSQVETPEQKEDNVDKNAIVKFLETASECQIKALGAFIEGGAKPVPVPTEAEVAAAAEARQAEIRAAVDAAVKADREQQAADAKKEASIKTLMAVEGQPFAKNELEAKTQGELDALVALAAKVAKPAAAATDFSGVNAGAPRTSDEPKEAPKARDLAAELRAAAQKK